VYLKDNKVDKALVVKLDTYFYKIVNNIIIANKLLNKLYPFIKEKQQSGTLKKFKFIFLDKIKLNTSLR
jgi:hypothetical protein